MNKVKILFVYPAEFGYFPDIYEYCICLKENGYSVYYLGTSNDIRKNNIIDGIKVFNISNKTKGYLTMSKNIAKIIEEISPHIVHVFHFRGCGLLPLLTKNKYKWVVDVRTINVGNVYGKTSKLNFIKDKITLIETLSYNNVLVLTEQIAKVLRMTFRPIKHIPLGASYDRLNPINKLDIREIIRNELGLREEDICLLYSGSISPGRNINKLINAFIIAQNTNKHIKLLIVGGNNDYPEFLDSLIKYTQMHGVEKKVIFTGRVKYTEVFKYYFVADIGISYVPTNKYFDEQPPTKLLEYMMSGLISVSTATKASQNIVNNGINGIICDDTPEYMARGILEGVSLLKESSKIVDNALNTVKKYNWKNIVKEELIPFYADIMER